MIKVTVNAVDYLAFSDAVKKGSPAVKHVFRDGIGFMAAHDSKEIRINPVGPEDRVAYDAFFHGHTTGFKGVVSAPDYEDFDIPEPPAPVVAEETPPEEPKEEVKEEAPPEAPPVEEVKPEAPKAPDTK